MEASRTLPAAALALAMLLAGCLGASDGQEPLDPAGAADADAMEGEQPLPAFDLRGEDCREGGGHSVHPKGFNPLPEPWVPADVIEDVGPQVVWSQFFDPRDPKLLPEEGNTIGNYHATLVCASWTFNGEPLPADHALGFVGMKVEQPSFLPLGPGEEEPTRQYLITVLTSSSEEVVAAMQAAGFDHAALGTGAIAEEEGDLVHQVLDTSINGEYRAIFLPKEMGAMPEGVVRLWWQMPVGDDHADHGDAGHGATAEGAFRPIALDLANSPGGVHLASEGQGYFHHHGTEDHWPFPGAYGYTAALLYEDFDRAVDFGPRPDVELEEAYVHL